MISTKKKRGAGRSFTAAVISLRLSYASKDGCNTESYELRDYPRLIEASRRGVILDPQDSFQHYLLGVGYEGVADIQQAIAEYKKACEISSGFNLATVALAHADSALGKKAESEKILRDLEHKEFRFAIHDGNRIRPAR